MQEETGITGFNPRLYETVELQPEPGIAGSHYLLSVCLVEAGADTVVRADSDALEAGWYLPEDALALPMPESVRACILRLAPNSLETL